MSTPLLSELVIENPASPMHGGAADARPDIMSLPTITVAPGTPVVDIAKQLLENGISAVPVVEPDGTVVGVVSETDLMHRPEVGTDKARVSWLHTLIGGTETPRDYTKTRGLKARDVMSAELYTASPDADLIDVVDIMDRLDVRRVLIMEEQRLVGIVTRSDILKGLLAGRSAAAKQAGDRAIRAMLIDELQRHPWVSLPHDNIEVADGVVRFWGEVGSEDERDALRVAAENVPGVKAVEDETTIRQVHLAED